MAKVRRPSRDNDRDELLAEGNSYILLSTPRGYQIWSRADYSEQRGRSELPEEEFALNDTGHIAAWAAFGQLEPEVLGIEPGEEVDALPPSVDTHDGESIPLSDWTLADVELKPSAYLFRWATALLRLVVEAVGNQGEEGAFCQLYQHGTNPKASNAQVLSMDRLDREDGRWAIAQRFNAGLEGVAGFTCLEGGSAPRIHLEAHWSGRDLTRPNGPSLGTNLALSLKLKYIVGGKLRPLDGNAELVFVDPLPGGTHPSSSRAQSALLGVADEIAKLAELHQKGILSNEEFATQKARLLSL